MPANASWYVVMKERLENQLVMIKNRRFVSVLALPCTGEW